MRSFILLIFVLKIVKILLKDSELRSIGGEVVQTGSQSPVSTFFLLLQLIFKLKIHQMSDDLPHRITSQNTVNVDIYYWFTHRLPHSIDIYCIEASTTISYKSRKGPVQQELSNLKCQWHCLKHRLFNCESKVIILKKLSARGQKIGSN